jgi:Mce-associated membrane protein
MATKTTHPESDTEDVTPPEGHSDNDIDAGQDPPDTISPRRKPMAPMTLATVGGLVIVVVLASLAGWLGMRAYHVHERDAQTALLLAGARQGAINLTTIDWEHADADVQRVLDSATGAFHDDFAKRSQPFIDVVKQAQSKSVGTITEAGLESQSGNSAQVLVAVAVKTSVAGAPDPNPRAWRMRISVVKDGDQAKVSNVEFVP